MTKKGDTYVSFPPILATKIKMMISNSDGMYDTVTEFVRDAVREKILRIENMEKKHK